MKRKCDEVGLYILLCEGESSKEGRTFPSHANIESEGEMAEDRDRKSFGMG